MSTYTQILYQLVFGSRNHLPFLNEVNEGVLFAYISGLLKNKNCHSYIVGGFRNHIHIVTHIHPSICPSSLVKDIKEATTCMIKDQHDLFSEFPGWQVGFAAFTYHISAKSKLINYVVNQRPHHSKKSFEDEVITLLKEHEVEYKEEYLFK